MKEVDYTKYGSVYDLFADLKVPKDHWSFIVDKEVFDNYFSGKGYIGFGFKFSYINGKYMIEYVYSNSPAKSAGMQRGDELVSVDGTSVSNLSKDEVAELFGDRKVGVQKSIKLKKQDGSSTTLQMKKENIEVPSVLQKKVIEQNGKKVGYLLFDRFIEPSTKELYDAFRIFKNQGINELVVDLRYNGGGLVSVAGALGSLIRAEDDEKLLFTLQFNDKNRNKDMTYHLRAVDNSLSGINRVYFLTTKSTCSASEAVINGLKPYTDVVVIGSKTCGKPVGMVGGEFCGKYIVPIEFKIVNSNGDGDYFGGLDTTCQVADDLTHDLGSSNESMLKTALYYIDNGSCGSSNGRLYRKSFDINKNASVGADSVMNAY